MAPPIPPNGPNGFGFVTTAEEVTAGLDLTGTRWLITGANSGLGLESARVLALRGAHIVAAARTLDKAKAALASLDLGPDRGTPVACELSDLESVRSCIATVAALNFTTAPLDGIMANAGIMALPELRQHKGYELQFYTNHVGHFVLVTGLIDQLTPTGRVVIVSSAAHRMAPDAGIEFDNLAGTRDYHPWRMYGQSKVANILFTRALARRFADAGSKRTANTLHPGVIRTNLGGNIPDVDAMYESLKDRVALKTVEQGAATQCYVATAPALADVSGVYFSDCNVETPTAIAQDDALAEKLWTVTEEIVAAG